MLSNIKDLLSIDDKIKEIDHERQSLLTELNNIENLQELRNNKNEFFDKIVNDIKQIDNNLDKVENLRDKYGNLQIFDILEGRIMQQMSIENNQNEWEQIDSQIDDLIHSPIETLNMTQLNQIHDSLNNIISEGHLSRDDLKVQSTLNKFDQNLLDPFGKLHCSTFNKLLLESYWDSKKFSMSNNEVIDSLRENCNSLFKLSSLYFKEENKTLWNFVSLANNFQTRFTYHFHNSTNASDIHIYFKYLNDYLSENLYKCITLFENDSIGLSNYIIHEQFINHILKPMRNHINTTLNNNNLKSLIILISQIIQTDKNLIDNFHYHGLGLVSLISNEFWISWINYEIEIVNKQFKLIIDNPTELPKSSFNFTNMLNKIFTHFQTFMELGNSNLLPFKLRICNEIFLNLPIKFLDYILLVDSLHESASNEERLYQTILKLELLNTIYKHYYKLSNEFIFITMTDKINTENSTHSANIFHDILKDYRSNMEIDLQNSIVHRIQKMIKESLRTYFKINSWIIDDTNFSNTTSSEVVNTLNLLKKLTLKLESSDIPTEILFNIKNQILNVVVKYFLESVLKLNKFNINGLNQFKIDFTAVKDTLNIQSEFHNVNEANLEEIMEILHIKYDSDVDVFTKTSYIQKGNFSDLKSKLNIKLLDDNEIQDALFRISYGNII